MSTRPVLIQDDPPPVPCWRCGEAWVEDHISVCDECRKDATRIWLARVQREQPGFETPAWAAKALAGDKPKRKGDIPEGLRWEVFERDNFTCRQCGSRRMLRADHVVPEGKGGPTTLDNLQTLCERCNCRKGRHVRRRA